MGARRRSLGARPPPTGQRALTAAGKRFELGEGNGLGGAVDLECPVAARADVKADSPGLGAGQRQDDLAHGRADALEGSEPVARFQDEGFGLPRSGKAGVGRDLAPPAAPALDDDRDQVRLLHRPHAFDELGDWDAVRAVDAQHDERFGDVVGQLGLVVKVELLERLENVIEPAKALSPILIGPIQHR